MRVRASALERVCFDCVLVCCFVMGYALQFGEEEKKKEKKHIREYILTTTTIIIIIIITEGGGAPRLSAVQRQGQGGAGQHLLRHDGRLHGVQAVRVPLQRVLVLPRAPRHQHLRPAGGAKGTRQCQTCRGLCRVPVLLCLRKVGWCSFLLENENENDRL